MKPEGAGAKNNTVQKVRRPWLAALLSICLPGLGHLYCGRIIKGALFLVCAFAIGNIAYAVVVFSDSNPFNILVPLSIALVYFILVIVSAYRTARSVNEEFTLKWYNKWYIYLIIILAAVLSVDWVIPVFGDYKSFKMPASSMENTLMAREYFLADLSAYKSRRPEMYDVIIFLWPGDQKTKYVKRCIAGPGDIVEFRDKRLFVNEMAAELPATAILESDKTVSRDKSVTDSRDNFGPFEVPPDHYFTVGDNLDNSYDSRFWGPVPENLILGKAVRIYWSPDIARIGLAVY